ncbi:uncharacterized protein LOC114328375 isoform X3 [Diabrotica virgifera virgifera]|uniref:Uncharacterized protein n=1 Tax=Diabrotica virgifera virgifera TaxID=50390 RepID=A0ABM5KJ63_DIAVI|nr:uncharacterized protein LOC114328375 isoform X2 [Diabrotica virgifera virgifera]XP_050510244.1 uncharacterized protein LOC114328375 isoform X3 [Diabrotica virgifera virgifera]
MPRENSPLVSGAVSGDGRSTPFLSSPVRKERLKKSKKELSAEAKRVIHQADRLDCATSPKGVDSQKFYTLQNRKKKKEYFSGSLDRRTKRKNSLEPLPPKKPPRTFTSKYSQKSSIFDIFKREKPPAPKKSNLRRSTSDVSNKSTNINTQSDSKFRKRSGSDSEEFLKRRKEKKQLSPIIEVTQREDYFSAPELDYSEKESIQNKENLEPKGFVRKKKKESITEQLKQFIDEVDEELYKETGIRVPPPEEQKPPQPIIIDVEKAQQISNKEKKFKHSLLARKIKSITGKKKQTNDTKTSKKQVNEKNKQSKLSEKKDYVKQTEPSVQFETSQGTRIKETIEHLENPKDSPKMIHSSQMPAEKLPLTKGRTVNSLIKRLSTESTSPPPLKTNILITPHATVQHNNNQPFSYTRGLSPDKYNETSPTPGSPIIYAQVVCGNNGNGTSKQTVHTSYSNGRKHTHSDSDEGLGGEEHLGFKTITRFGDDYDEVDKIDEESPIRPKFRNPAYLNGYSSYERKEVSNVKYIDSSARGRGDGMDSKRRESLTEPHETTFTSTTMLNSRSDLSARRDQLESRINRRVNDNSIRTSPEYLKNPYPTNVYVTETTSKHYKSGSSSPVGYTEKYSSETRTDKHGKHHTKESRSVQYLGNEHKERLEYENRGRPNGHHYNGFDNEPKSFDSQISSSPENRRYETSHSYKKDEYRTFHKSTPDIYRSHQDSLQRENVERRTGSSNYRSEYYEDSDRRERFADSGIENDFRRDSRDNFRSRPRHRRDYCNESEDEGFASSLLIASERQHTEDNINNRKRRDYDSDRAVSREDDQYRHIETMDYKSKVRSNDYVPRERSIDDGSHYDPRIDKDVEIYTVRRNEKKPPKPEKKSGLDKVKSLFSRDTKKKKEKVAMVREESLRARYVEYKGRSPVEPKFKKQEVNSQTNYDRRRLSSPSPSPTREHQRNVKSESTHGSWFKSLDRLSRKKSKKGEKDANFTSGTEDDTPTKPTKNLRFFGDTDQESNDSIRHKTSTKTRAGIPSRARSQSTRELHNISEEFKSPRNNYKSMTNVSESERETKESRRGLKPPMSPNHRTPSRENHRTPSREHHRTPSRETSRHDKERSRRRKNEVSSVESSTEGDSSQQSQRSIVYLHAATVGDIPGPGYLKNGRRAASREELASNGSKVQQVKTLSRSFSVLAPWKPRNPRDVDIDYSQYPKNGKNGKYEQKISKTPTPRKDSSSTLKKKAQESRKNYTSSNGSHGSNGSTLLKLSKSKENLSSQTLRRSKENLSKGSNSTLYKKKDRYPNENSRYTREKEEKKMASKSLSVESLGGQERRHRDVSRSVSMPRNPEKSAGWFKMSKKNKMSSAQRL